MDNALRIEIERLKRTMPKEKEQSVGELTGQSPNWTDSNHAEALQKLLTSLGEQPRGAEVTVSDHLSVLVAVNHLVFIVAGVPFAVAMVRGEG